jgi:hypothetical protein
MIDTRFTVILTGAQLNLIGNAIEQAKAALDVVALDVQKQVNDALAQETAAAEDARAKAEKQLNDDLHGRSGSEGQQGFDEDGERARSLGPARRPRKR